MTRRLRLVVAGAVCGLACGLWPGGAVAQALPSEPVSLGDGRVVVSGDVAASIAPEDTGFFNYSDYDSSTLRTIRAALSAQWRASTRVSLLGEIRADNLSHVEPVALYVRIRPLPERRLDIQVGRIPPTFGRFARLAYSRDNLLIGYPLAYQYLTSLRPDALPASPDELLRMRGRGWLASYTIGDPDAEPGVPLISTYTWDTGVQVATGWKTIDVAAALTSGTTSQPRVADDNGGKQLATRVAWAPAAAFSLGSSFARGAFVSRRAVAASGAAGNFMQTSFGIDAEYAIGHLLLRGEGITSAWDLPFAQTRTVATVRSGALSVEGKYALVPGAYLAARAERLTFNRVTTTTGTAAWEAPVSRLEVGGGVSILRNVQARASVQFNTRDGGRVTHERFLAAQLLYWF